MCHIVVLVQFTGPGGLKVSSGLCCQIHNHRARLHPVNHCLETEFFQSQINNNKHAIIDNSLVDSQKYKSLSIFTKFKIWSLSFANKSRNKKIHEIRSQTCIHHDFKPDLWHQLRGWLARYEGSSNDDITLLTLFGIQSFLGLLELLWHFTDVLSIASLSSSWFLNNIQTKQWIKAILYSLLELLLIIENDYSWKFVFLFSKLSPNNFSFKETVKLKKHLCLTSDLPTVLLGNNK